MNFVDFIIQLFAGKMQFSVDDLEATKTALKEKFDNADNKVVNFLKSPYVLLILPFLLPVLKRGIDALLMRWIGDEDQDEDADIQDAILKLNKWIAAKKGLDNGN